MEGLRKLEYRGYDPAGIAVVGADGKLDLRRASGKLRNLEEVIRKNPLVGTFERILADDFFEIAQFSRRAAEVKLSVGANDSDAGGIVAAIFELSQAFNDDRDDLFRADVAHDTAHLLH